MAPRTPQGMPTAHGRRRPRPATRTRWRKSNLPPAVMQEVMSQLPRGAKNVRVMRNGPRGKKFRVLYESGGRNFQVFPWNVSKTNFRLYPEGQVANQTQSRAPTTLTGHQPASPTAQPHANPHDGRREMDRVEREPERPHAPVPNRIEPDQLEGIGRQLQELKQQRAEAMNQLLGGPERHREFRAGLKSTRGGIVSGLRGLASPATWWRSGPGGSLAKVIDSVRHSRSGTSGAALRAAPGGKKIYTTRGAERKRAKKLDKIRGAVNPESLRATLAEYNGAVDHAFAQLAHNPTPAQYQAYERQLAEANKNLQTAQIAIERAFRQRVRKTGATTGGGNTSQTRKLSRL